MLPGTLILKEVKVAGRPLKKSGMYILVSYRKQETTQKSVHSILLFKLSNFKFFSDGEGNWIRED